MISIGCSRHLWTIAPISVWRRFSWNDLSVSLLLPPTLTQPDCSSHWMMPPSGDIWSYGQWASVLSHQIRVKMPFSESRAGCHSPFTFELSTIKVWVMECCWGELSFRQGLSPTPPRRTFSISVRERTSPASRSPRWPRLGLFPRVGRTSPSQTFHNHRGRCSREHSGL